MSLTNTMYLQLSDNARWQAISARDKNSDGAFVYCVKTTGIYCRPACPSRLARRANVEFYDDCAQAESAGYRPCKRCKPDCQSDPIQQVCQKLCASQRVHSLEELARQGGLSKHHFHRVFKRRTGLTPKQFAAVVKENNEMLERASTMPMLDGGGMLSGNQDLQYWLANENPPTSVLPCSLISRGYEKRVAID